MRLQVKIIIHVTAVLLFITTNAYSYDSRNDREKIGVTDFEASNKQIGASVTTAIIGKIGELKRFDLIEREQLSKILSESAFQMSGLTENTIETLRLSSIKLLVIGTISQFSVKMKEKMYEAHFSANYRIVDIESGNIIFSTSISSTDLSFYEKSSLWGHSSNETEVLAVEYISKQVLQSIKKYYSLEARIIETDGSEVKMDRGLEDGVKTGQTFSVIEEGAFRKQVVGKIKIDYVEADFSVGKIIDGHASIGALLKESEGLKVAWGVYLDAFFTERAYQDFANQSLKTALLGGRIGIDYPNIYETNFGWRIYASSSYSGALKIVDVGGGVFYQFWVKEDLLSLPIFVGVTKRTQTINTPNALLNEYIPNFPVDSIAGETPTNAEGTILVPEIALQYYINDRLSLMVGVERPIVINETSWSTNWNTQEYEIPEQYIVQRNSKESLGRILFRLKISFP